MSGSVDRIVLGSADLLDVPETTRVLDRFFEEGGRNLDLANVYANGESPRAVGRWLASAGIRDQLTLFAKGCHPPFCSPELVLKEVDEARWSLQTEFLDVFILHRDDPAVSAAEWAAALSGEIERGAVGAVGVSNWTVPRFDDLRLALAEMGRDLRVFSNHFSLADMIQPTWPGCLAMTGEDIEYVSRAGSTVLAWASLAGGYFAGRDLPSWSDEENGERRARARELASRLGISTPAIALAYVLHRHKAVLPVIGTRSEAHLAELLQVSTISLSDEDLRLLVGD